ncbi:hypothetical protein [Mobilicoccus sp.]|uniref:hypothetical protein n=1 Tax=Mobilicoccus sp. TaxID=2034349 RepID=UPI0028A706A8|nr:hypothetical protein [Mobilicoccus sp.]
MSSPRRDIAEAEARMRVTFGTRTAIKNLHEIIHEDETVQELAACLYAGGDGVLILTDKRILGLRDDYSKYHYRDHALTGAQKLDYDPVIHDGFALTTATGRLVVRKMHVEDSGRLVARLRALVPGLVLEVTRPGARGRVPIRPADPAAPAPGTPTPDGVAAAATDQAYAAGAAVGAFPPPPSPSGDQAEADKRVLMGVLADLHAKGLLSDAELAAKLAQVAAQP